MISLKKVAAFGVVLGLAVVFVAPTMVVFGQTVKSVGSSDPKKQDVCPEGQTCAPDKRNFQLVSCDGVQKYLRDAQGEIKYDNGKPMLDPDSVECDYNQLIVTIQRIINFALWLITPIVVGMMVFTGFKYVTAGGDANLLADAKRMIVPIFTGIFFIMCGWLLVYTVLDKLLDKNVSPDIKKTDILPEKIGPTTAG